MKLNQYLKPAQQFEGAFVHTSVGTDAEFDDCYVQSLITALINNARV